MRGADLSSGTESQRVLREVVGFHGDVQRALSLSAFWYFPLLLLAGRHVAGRLAALGRQKKKKKGKSEAGALVAERLIPALRENLRGSAEMLRGWSQELLRVESAGLFFAYFEEAAKAAKKLVPELNEELANAVEGCAQQAAKDNVLEAEKLRERCARLAKSFKEISFS